MCAIASCILGLPEESMKFGIVFLLFVAVSGPLFQGRQPEVQVKGLENRIFDLINVERVRARTPPLKPWIRSWLIVVALCEHSRAMASEGFFDHVSPLGQGPSDRAKSAGYVCRHQVGLYVYGGIGENILQNNLYSRADHPEAVRLFTNGATRRKSPGRRYGVGWTVRNIKPIF